MSQSISPLRVSKRNRTQADTTMRKSEEYDRIKHYEQMNSKLQSQLDEAMFHLQQMHMQADYNLKEQQPTENNQLVKSLRAELKLKCDDIDHLSNRLQQQNKQQQIAIESLRNQYELLQQSSNHKHTTELSMKLNEQRNHYEAWLKQLNVKSEQSQLLNETANVELQTMQTLLTEQEQERHQLNSQLDEITSNLYREKSRVQERDMQIEQLQRNVVEINSEKRRIESENVGLREKCLRLEQHYQEDMNQLIVSKNKQSEEEISKHISQHESSQSKLGQQNQELWRQLQDSKLSVQVAQKEIKRLNEQTVEVQEQLQLKTQTLLQVTNDYNEKVAINLSLKHQLQNIEQQMNALNSQLIEQQNNNQQFEQRVLERNKGLLRERELEFDCRNSLNEERIRMLEGNLETLEEQLQQASQRHLQDKLCAEQLSRQLQGKVNNYEEIIANTTRELNETKEQLEEITAQFNTTSQLYQKDKSGNTQQQRVCKNTINELQIKLKEYQIEVDRLSSDVRDREETLEVQRIQFMNEKEQLEQTIKAIFDKMSQYKSRIQDVEENNYTLNLQLSQVTKLKQQLEIDLQQLQFKSDEQSKQLKYQVTTLEKEVDDFKRLQMNIEELTMKINTERQVLNNTINELHQQNDELQHELDDLSEELKHTQQTMQSRSLEMDQWKKQYQQNHVPLDVYEQLKQQNDFRKTSTMDLEQEVLKLESDKQQLGKQLHNVTDEYAYVKQQLQDITQTLASKKKENDQLSLDADSLRRENTRYLGQLRELEAKDIVSQESITKYRKEAQRVNDEYEIKQRQYLSMEQALNKKQDELAQKNRELDEYKKNDNCRQSTSPVLSMQTSQRHQVRQSKLSKTSFIQNENQQQY